MHIIISKTHKLINTPSSKNYKLWPFIIPPSNSVIGWCIAREGCERRSERENELTERERREKEEEGESSGKRELTNEGREKKRLRRGGKVRETSRKECGEKDE